MDKNKKKRVIQCSNCGVSKTEDPSVKRRIDPYEADINNTIKYRNLCDRCEHEFAQDI